MIRIPIHTQELKHGFLKAQERQRDASVHTLNYGTIAAELGVSQQRLLEMERTTQSPVSLDSPVSEMEEESLEEFIPGYDSPGHEVFQQLIAQELEKILERLNEREQLVVKMRFGLSGYPVSTLEEVGAVLHLTRERIRQISIGALNKLQHPILQERLIRLRRMMRHEERSSP